MKRMTMISAQWSLAITWLTGVGVVAMVLIGQSLGGRYGASSEQAWGWFLPTVMPTLMLIIGVLVAAYRGGAAGTDSRARRVEKPIFLLALILSALYLLLVAASILLQPFLSQTPPLQLMQRSSLWLGPFQGLVAAVLGVFFNTKA